MIRPTLLKNDVCLHQSSVCTGYVTRDGVSKDTTVYYCDRTAGNRKSGRCDFSGHECDCPFYLSHNEYYNEEWRKHIESIEKEAELLFPYETEESCPIAFERISKNKCIDCIRAGYVRGYIEGEDKGYVYPAIA